MHKAVLAITIAAVTAVGSITLPDAPLTMGPERSTHLTKGHHICAADFIFYPSASVPAGQSIGAYVSATWCDENKNVVFTGTPDPASWTSSNSSVASVSPSSNAANVTITGLSVGTSTIRAYAICGGYYNGLPGCAAAEKTVTVTTALLDGSISGPGQVTAGSMNWWTANVYGGNPPYTIQWPGGTTGTSYGQSFSNVGTPYNTVLYVNVSDNAGHTKQLSYNIRVCPTGVEDC